jgi:hypothetical protein
MRLFELVDSDQQLLDLVKPILIRARSEGADTVDMQQIINDLDSEDSVTPEVMVDLLNRHRSDLADMVVSSTRDSIQLNKGETKAMKSRVDGDLERIKKTAVKQARDQLK